MKKIVMVVSAVAVLSSVAFAQPMPPAMRHEWGNQMYQAQQAEKSAKTSKIEKELNKQAAAQAAEQANLARVLSIVQIIRENVASAKTLADVQDCEHNAKAALLAQNYLNVLETSLSTESREKVNAELFAPLKVKFQKEDFTIENVVGSWYSYLSSITTVQSNSR